MLLFCLLCFFNVQILDILRFLMPPFCHKLRNISMIHCMIRVSLSDLLLLVETICKETIHGSRYVVLVPSAHTFALGLVLRRRPALFFCEPFHVFVLRAIQRTWRRHWFNAIPVRHSVFLHRKYLCNEMKDYNRNEKEC